MSSAIIGFGAIGQALARTFARKSIPVAVASRRAPEAIAPQARAIGPSVTASSLQEALKAQIVILAVPFGLQDQLAKAADWQGKIVIDATNAYGVCQRRSKTRPVGRSKTRPLTVRADPVPRTSERRCVEPLRSAAHRRGVRH